MKLTPHMSYEQIAERMSLAGYHMTPNEAENIARRALTRIKTAMRKSGYKAEDFLGNRDRELLPVPEAKWRE